METTVEANRDIGRKFFQEQDRLRGGPAPELCAPGYSARFGGNPPLDRAGHEAFARAFYSAMPDARHEVEQVIAERDAVVVRFVVHGTHTAPLGAIPASGNAIAVAAHVILRLSGGRVKDLCGVFDEAGMLRQMGALPAH
jgi:predicted ester cyclase